MIHRKTTIHNLLVAYPQLEQVLIEMSPAFKNLKNPILRNSVAKIATIELAAIIGAVDLNKMLRRLRIHVAQVPQ